MSVYSYTGYYRGPLITIVISCYRSMSAGDIEAVLETHQHMQDKLAEDMIAMAKSLRSNALVARDVIKSDNKVIMLSLRQ